MTHGHSWSSDVEPRYIIIPMDAFLSHIHIKLLNENFSRLKSSTRPPSYTKCEILSDQSVNLKSMLCRSGSVLHSTGIFCLRQNYLSTLSGWCHSPIWKHIKGLMVCQVYDSCLTSSLVYSTCCVSRATFYTWPVYVVNCPRG